MKSTCRQRIPESWCVREKTGDGKITQAKRITRESPAKIRKWKKVCLFRWTSSKIIPREKNLLSTIPIMPTLNHAGFSSFFISLKIFFHTCYLAALRPTLVHYFQVTNSLTYLICITDLHYDVTISTCRPPKT